MELRKLERRDALRLLEERGVRSLEFRFGTARHLSVVGEEEIRGGIERVSDGTDVEARMSANEGLVFRGHAAVFERLSLDLGYFKERIAPGAFDAVLATSPHTTANWNHDDNLAFASTRGNRGNGDLELRIDALGLRWYAHPAFDPETNASPSYVEDLRILMRSGVVAQSSFKFVVGRDEWHIDADENITRTLIEIDELFDVCACAIAAYPQTDSEADGRGLDDGGSGSPVPRKPVLDGPTASALAEADAARQRTLADAERRRRLASARATSTLRRAS